MDINLINFLEELETKGLFKSKAGEIDEKFKKFINICIESKPGEVILKDELHHIEENEEKNIDEKIKEIEDEEKKEFFKGDL